MLRLLELGADPRLVNDEGRTALELGRDNPALHNTYAPLTAWQPSPSSRRGR